MMFFLNSTLRNKLLLMVMIITLVTCVLMSVGFLTYDRITATYYASESRNLIAKLLQTSLTQALTSGDEITATELLPKATSDSEVQLSCLYGKNDTLFASSTADNGLKCPDNLPTNDHFLGGKYNGSIYKIVTGNGMDLGSLVLVSPLWQINEHTLYSSLLFLFITLVACMVAYMLAKKIQSSITTPVIDIVSTVRKIAEKRDYQLRAFKYYPDEVGEIATSLNSILSNIENHDSELKDMKATFEQKVQERTQILEEAKAKAEHSNESKNAFLRNMSHEFRTPLHAMNSFSLFGMEETATHPELEPLNRYFMNINKSTSRLTNLVDGMLNIARMENGQQLMCMKQSDLRMLTNSILLENQSLIDEKHLTIINDDLITPTEVTCDETKIMQVITNLLSNAIKFIENGKIIRISYSRDMVSMEEGQRPVPALLLTISDEGIGIPAGEEERIFEKFVQSTRTDLGAGGTGLGLAISRGFIHSHKGKIWARNNEHRGASFTFAIPADLPEGKLIVNL